MQNAISKTMTGLAVVSSQTVLAAFETFFRQELFQNWRLDPNGIEFWIERQEVF